MTRSEGGDVDEIKNTGRFEARLKIPEGDLVVAFDRFREFAPCQSGPKMDQRNKPGRELFMHFFGMEVTWK